MPTGLENSPSAQSVARNLKTMASTSSLTGIDSLESLLQIITTLAKNINGAPDKGTISKTTKERWSGELKKAENFVKTLKEDQEMSLEPITDLAATPLEDSNQAQTAIDGVIGKITSLKTSVEIKTSILSDLVGISAYIDAGKMDNIPSVITLITGMATIKEQVEQLQEQNKKLSSQIEELLQAKSTTLPSQQREEDHLERLSEETIGNSGWNQVVRKNTKNQVTPRPQAPISTSQKNNKSSRKTSQVNPPKANRPTLQTVRIKATKPENKLDQLLKGVNIPSNLKGTKVLEDGSMVLYVPEAAKLEETLKKVDNIEIVPKSTFLPRLKVLFVPSDANEEEVQSAFNGSTVRLLRTIKIANGQQHLIYEVDPECFKKFKGQKIFLPGWIACRVVECSDAPLCTKCLKPGHNAENCTRTETDKICAKCAQTGHTTNECTSEVKCCINCKRSKRKNTTHSAFDQRCPELISYSKRRQANTNYGQEC